MEVDTKFDWQRIVASEDGPESPTTRHVLLTLCMHMSRSGSSCFPSLRTLQGETGLDRSTVVRHIKKSRSEGWLRVENTKGSSGGNSSNRYYATLPTETQKMLARSTLERVGGGCTGQPGGGCTGQPGVVAQDNHNNHGNNQSGSNQVKPSGSNEPSGESDLPLSYSDRSPDEVVDQLPQEPGERDKVLTELFVTFFGDGGGDPWRTVHGRLAKIRSQVQVDTPHEWMVRALYRIESTDHVSTHREPGNQRWNESIAPRVLDYLEKMKQSVNESEDTIDDSEEAVDAYFADL